MAGVWNDQFKAVSRLAFLALENIPKTQSFAILAAIKLKPRVL